MTRSKSWEIAADLEDAAGAVRDASLVMAECDKSVWPEINTIVGIEHFDAIADALQALSDKYQAIADAEPDDRDEYFVTHGLREEDLP